MKAKDLIAKLQEYDPEKEIAAWGCMYCAGDSTTEIEIDDYDHTVWDSVLKKTVTHEVLLITGR